MGFENILLILILVGVLFFGAKKLPELARSLGKVQSEFEKGRLESVDSASVKVDKDKVKQDELISKLGINGEAS
ncbi:MAG TPA: twin-arginine translocase TatA/TatE family subunit [Nitrososphaeraceae archaeon]